MPSCRKPSAVWCMSAEVLPKACMRSRWRELCGKWVWHGGWGWGCGVACVMTHAQSHERYVCIHHYTQHITHCIRLASHASYRVFAYTMVPHQIGITAHFAKLHQMSCDCLVQCVQLG